MGRKVERKTCKMIGKKMQKKRRQIQSVSTRRLSIIIAKCQQVTFVLPQSKWHNVDVLHRTNMVRSASMCVHVCWSKFLLLLLAMELLLLFIDCRGLSCRFIFVPESLRTSSQRAKRIVLWSHQHTRLHDCPLLR